MKDLNENIAAINDVLNEVAPDRFKEYYLPHESSSMVDVRSPVDTIYRNIIRKNKPGCFFLSGQRGSGKTTQLFSLKQKLEAEKYFVIYCDLSSKINLFDLHYVDFFMALLKSITEQLVNKDIYLNYTVLGKVHLTELRDMIPFKSLDFNLKFSMISDYIKYSDCLREKVRYIFDSQAISFVDGLKDVLNQARKILQDLEFKDIVVIVDGLDHSNIGINSSKINALNLFTDYNLLIKSFETKMVVTLPLDIVFSPDVNRIKTVWNEDIFVVPLYTTKGDTTRKQYSQILDKRCALIGYKQDNIAEGKVVKTLAHLSGGNIGQFMNLFSHCLNECDDLPISDKVVNQVKIGYKQRLLSSLSLEDIELINNFTSKTLDRGSCITRKLINANVLFYSSVNGQFYLNPII